MKDVMIVTGAGQIGMAIARRMGYGMKIVMGDKKAEHAEAIAKTMNDAGFDVTATEMDLSSRQSILELIAKARIRPDTTIYMDYGENEMANHVASQAVIPSAVYLLMTKGVNLAFRIVPGGNHSEASWEKQIPIFMECLGL